MAPTHVDNVTWKHGFDYQLEFFFCSGVLRVWGGGAPADVDDIVRVAHRAVHVRVVNKPCHLKDPLQS